MNRSEVRNTSVPRIRTKLRLKSRQPTAARFKPTPESSLPLLPRHSKMNQSLIVVKSQPATEFQQHHRLSIDGTLGLQVLLMEKRDEKGRPRLKMHVQGSQVPETKKKTEVLPPPRVSPMLSTFAKAEAQTRTYDLRRSSVHTSLLVPHTLETPKSIQRFAYRSQTGLVAGKPKKNNQDSYLICQDFAGGKNQWLFGVFDGHGPSGHTVSAHIKRSLPQHLHEFLSNSHRALSEAEIMSLSQGLATCYQRIHSELQRSSYVDSTVSGSTAVTVLAQGDFLLCANTGDSRAVIGRMQSHDTWVSLDLSKDHKPADPAEKSRIERAGGRVEPSKGELYADHTGNFQGPPRVWQPHEATPGLAMSRSLGDTTASELGVIPDPDVTWLRLSRDDKFLILASDGIWEFLSSEQVVDIISPYYSSGNVDGACDRLVKEALQCWRMVTHM